MPKQSAIIKPWSDEWHSFVVKDNILVEVIDYYKTKRDIISVLGPIEKVFQKRYGNEDYQRKTFPLPQELWDGLLLVAG